jgi:hypothetical protein
MSGGSWTKALDYGKRRERAFFHAALHERVAYVIDHEAGANRSANVGDLPDDVAWWLLEFHPSRSWLMVPADCVRSQMVEGRVQLRRLLSDAHKPHKGIVSRARDRWLPRDDGASYDGDLLEVRARQDSAAQAVTWSRYEHKSNPEGWRYRAVTLEVERERYGDKATTDPSGVFDPKLTAQWWVHEFREDHRFIIHIEHARWLAREHHVVKGKNTDGARTYVAVVPLEAFFGLPPVCPTCGRGTGGLDRGRDEDQG